MIRILIALCLTLFFIHWAGATEVRGRLTGLSNANVTVSCAQKGAAKAYTKATPVGNDGQFRFGNVPDERACTLVIELGGAKTTPYLFHTTSGELTINREIRKYGKRLVAL